MVTFRHRIRPIRARTRTVAAVAASVVAIFLTAAITLAANFGVIGPLAAPTSTNPAAHAALTTAGHPVATHLTASRVANDPRD